MGSEIIIRIKVIKMNFLRIQEIQISNLNASITANAIGWTCINLDRGATSATLLCSLVYINESDLVSPTLYTWSMDVPNNVLQNWQSDEVIDDYVITYSPMFIKAV